MILIPLTLLHFTAFNVFFGAIPGIRVKVIPLLANYVSFVETRFHDDSPWAAIGEVYYQEYGFVALSAVFLLLAAFRFVGNSDRTIGGLRIAMNALSLPLALGAGTCLIAAWQISNGTYCEVLETLVPSCDLRSTDQLKFAIIGMVHAVAAFFLFFRFRAD